MAIKSSKVQPFKQATSTIRTSLRQHASKPERAASVVAEAQRRLKVTKRDYTKQELGPAVEKYEAEVTKKAHKANLAKWAKDNPALV